jgi:hypothetical protein
MGNESANLQDEQSWHLAKKRAPTTAPELNRHLKQLTDTLDTLVEEIRFSREQYLTLVEQNVTERGHVGSS